MAIWKIFKHDSDADGIVVGELPDKMSASAISEVLRRLVCKTLTTDSLKSH